MLKRFLGATCAFAFVASSAGAQQAPLIQAEQKFSIELYGHLASKPGNFVVAPYSIFSLLMIAHAGARGQTGDEMADALHVQGMNMAPLMKGAQTAAPFNLFGATFQSHSDEAIWVTSRFPVVQSFSALVSQGSGAILKTADFSDNRSAAAKIENWIATDAAANISNFAMPNMFSAQTGIVLTSIAYPHAFWSSVFNPEDEKQRYFHVSAGHDECVTMLGQTSVYDLTQTPDAKIITLPYQWPNNEGLSMIVILPNDDTGLGALESKVSAESLNKWLSEGQTGTVVSIELPKFNETSRFDLRDALQAMGMKQALDPAHANFTGIADVMGQHLYISNVLHEAQIVLDDAGTSDGVHPGANLGLTVNGGPPLPIVPFIADHPFLYLIRADTTGAILFMGRMEDPTKD